MELFSETAGKWQALVNQFSDNSVYQSYQYGEESWGASQVERVTFGRNGGYPTAVAQLRVVKIPLLGRGMAYVRWGPLWQRKGESPDPRVLRDCLRELALEYGTRRKLVLRIVLPLFVDSPYRSEVSTVFEELGYAAKPHFKRYNTAYLDLSPSLDVLRSNMHQRWRNHLKSAERSGFDISLETDDRAYGEFLGAYDEMFRRKRFKTGVDVAAFARIQSSLDALSRLRIFSARRDGHLCNALVIAPGGDTAIYLLAASTQAGLQGKAAFLLQWKAIEWLKSSGFKYYDLGGMNKETNPGVYQFKSGMGGKECSFLGCYEYCASAMSRNLIAASEKLPAAGKKALSWAREHTVRMVRPAVRGVS